MIFVETNNEFICTFTASEYPEIVLLESDRCEDGYRIKTTEGEDTTKYRKDLDIARNYWIVGRDQGIELEETPDMVPWVISGINCGCDNVFIPAVYTLDSIRDEHTEDNPLFARDFLNYLKGDGREELKEAIDEAIDKIFGEWQETQFFLS